MKRFARAALAASGLVALLSMSASGVAGEDAVYSTDAGAIRGYDPVAYFVESRPIKGDRKFSLQYRGVEWRFANAANRDRFAAAPERFAPQYGGYCAWAVAQGYTASVDPDAWRIVDGKLYLNYSAGVQRRWSEDIAGNIRKADGNWPGVLNR